MLWFVDGSGGESQFRTSLSNWSPSSKSQPRYLESQGWRMTNVPSCLSYLLSLAYRLISALGQGYTNSQAYVEHTKSVADATH
jgi:hypothetical protein